MGGENEGNGQPPLRPTRVPTVLGEDDFLPKHSLHFSPKGLVGVNEVDAALVAQRRRRNRFLVQRGNHLPVDILRDSRLGGRNAKLQTFQGLEQAIGLHLVGVTDTGPEVRVGDDRRIEHGVHGAHRRRASPACCI